MGQILRISAAMHVLFRIDMRMFHCPVQYQMRPLMQQLILLKCAASTQPIYQVGDFYSRNLIVLMQVC